MSAGELYAWQAGVDWARQGYRTAAILARPAADIERALGADVAATRSTMDLLVFGYWFRQGVDDFLTTPAR